jgi:hypothetical protein
MEKMKRATIHTGLIQPEAKWRTTPAGLLASPNGQPALAHAGAARVEHTLVMVTALRCGWSMGHGALVGG